MRFLLRIVPLGEGREEFLSTLRRLAPAFGARAVNPKWTSYGALEIDVFAERKSDFDTMVAALEPLGRVEFARDLQEAQPFLPKGEAVKEAISLFNGERFWEAHEVLESLWRVAEGDEKTLLQGLILVCAAYVHEQKGEPAVALGVLGRAIPKLVWDGRHYHGIDVRELEAVMARMLKQRKLAVLKL